MAFHPKIFQLASPKDKNLLLCNHSTIITPKKFCIDSVTPTNVKPIIKFLPDGSKMFFGSLVFYPGIHLKFTHLWLLCVSNLF